MNQEEEWRTTTTEDIFRLHRNQKQSCTAVFLFFTKLSSTLKSEYKTMYNSIRQHLRWRDRKENDGEDAGENSLRAFIYIQQIKALIVHSFKIFKHRTKLQFYSRSKQVVQISYVANKWNHCIFVVSTITQNINFYISINCKLYLLGKKAKTIVALLLLSPNIFITKLKFYLQIWMKRVPSGRIEMEG